MIDIRLVDKYDKETCNELIYKNLTSSLIFVDEYNYLSEGASEVNIQSPRLRVGAFKNDQLIGLSTGTALNKHTFLMSISLVDTHFRKQGIYNKMLKMVLNETKQYDKVISYHHLLNNPIISIKLRKNFYIMGLENSLAIGARIQLCYFNNKKLLEMAKFRAGLITHQTLQKYLETNP